MMITAARPTVKAQEIPIVAGDGLQTHGRHLEPDMEAIGPPNPRLSCLHPRVLRSSRPSTMASLQN